MPPPRRRNLPRRRRERYSLKQVGVGQGVAYGGPAFSSGYRTRLAAGAATEVDPWTSGAMRHGCSNVRPRHPAASLHQAPCSPRSRSAGRHFRIVSWSLEHPRCCSRGGRPPALGGSPTGAKALGEWSRRAADHAGEVTCRLAEQAVVDVAIQCHQETDRVGVQAGGVEGSRVLLRGER